MPSIPPFEIHAFSHDKLIQLLAENSEASEEVVRKKQHAAYFEEYFRAIHPESILVEHGYIDRDFLEDYSGFYVRCFRDYASVCTRLHFFSCAVTKATINMLLRGQHSDRFKSTLQKHYLGFIVVKPLPRSIIGRTCLKTYPDEGRRSFPILRPYSVNLFGLPLEIKETLAFQEQDTVAAACATSALWSTFQGTGRKFQHSIPSPVEITRAALARFPMNERDLPNHGLFSWQMAHAISSVGLEPYPITINDEISKEFCLQSSVYAYLRGGIPVPLLFRLHDVTLGRDIGGHAVAVTGFSLGRAFPVAYDASGFLLKASRIDKLYAHDDGVGPFARMVLETWQEHPVTGKLQQPPVLALTTSWHDSNGEVGNVYALPDSLLLPLYHKIRIPFRTALQVIRAFDEFLELREVKTAVGLGERMEWDIYLTEVNDVKQDVMESEDLPGPYRRGVLLEPMPKYMWRATATGDGRIILDILLDATDIEQGPLMVRAIEYDQNVGAALRQCTNTDVITQEYESHPVWALLRWFASQGA